MKKGSLLSAEPNSSQELAEDGKPDRKASQNSHVMKVLFRKETAEFINSKRMILFVILTALITVSGLYAAVSGLSEAVESG